MAALLPALGCPWRFWGSLGPKTPKNSQVCHQLAMTMHGGLEHIP